MALMKLLRLPTEEDLRNAGIIEARYFLNAFNAKAVADFTAKVEDEGNCVDLDGWKIDKADWFIVKD